MRLSIAVPHITPHRQAKSGTKLQELRTMRGGRRPSGRGLLPVSRPPSRPERGSDFASTKS